MTFSEISNDRIDITAPNGAPIASYRFGSLPKPCLHPLTTPRGHCLTAFEPSDHIWHRGLWFAVKFINGSNFWEERPPFGIQQSRVEPTCRAIDTDKIRIDHSLLWTSDATGPVLNEERTIIFSTTPDGSRQIDWSTTLYALADLDLDRTPFTTWGGYGGLYFRAALEMHDASFLIPNGQIVPNISGESHEWTVMQAQAGAQNANQKVSIAIIDHPSNPRSPTPWYNRSSPDWNSMNPAFLFHEPLKLPKDQSLRFHYRILYRDGQWDTADFADLADDFRTTMPPKG
jgi:methane monooxygenase PmoA-like